MADFDAYELNPAQVVPSDLGQLAQREAYFGGGLSGLAFESSKGYNRRVLAEKILLEMVRQSGGWFGGGAEYDGGNTAQMMAKDAVELAEAFLAEVGK